MYTKAFLQSSNKLVTLRKVPSAWRVGWFSSLLLVITEMITLRQVGYGIYMRGKLKPQKLLL